MLRSEEKIHKSPQVKVKSEKGMGRSELGTKVSLRASAEAFFQ